MSKTQPMRNPDMPVKRRETGAESTQRSEPMGSPVSGGKIPSEAKYGKNGTP